MAWNTSKKRLKFAKIAGKIFFKNCAGDKIATQSSLSDFWGGFQILKDVLHIRKDQNGPLGTVGTWWTVNTLSSAK